MPLHRIEITSTLPMRADAILRQLPSLGVHQPVTLHITDLYFLEGALTQNDLQRIAATLLSDPVTDQWHIIPGNRVVSFQPGVVEITCRPGVTDTVANELTRAIARLGITGLTGAATGIRYGFTGDLTPADLTHLTRNLLVNDTIQRYTLGEILPEFIHPPAEIHPPAQIDLRPLDDAALLALSAARRLALDLHEMRAVRGYFTAQARPASDAELETIAQTWSEHCVHKTFKAKITIENQELKIGNDSQSSILNSIIKTYLQETTRQIAAPWVRSAFVDNAGVIAFDDEYDLSFKVETHNHPSAIEPFGGANTGVGGVVRDVLGVSHRPIAVTDVLCFGYGDQPGEEVPAGALHPARVRAGVVAGIQDYGNKLGLPTVNGAVVYHPGYTANPLVYCGCVGLGPRDSHPRGAQPGDRVIVIGGRTGRDGLRGATFSSLTMDAQTGQVAGASVQIGDPVTEKGVIEAVERARDARLYHAITDCGAGGLSSAVGEMGGQVGARVDLANVPLKYAGLEPWEIWLSEAQERMVLAVPPGNVAALREICDTYWVELSDIGYFGVAGSRLQVVHGELPVVDLDMAFLHACPRMELTAEIRQSQVTGHRSGTTFDLQPATFTLPDLLLQYLAHPNISSKESILRLYDHEVRGMTVVKPLAGVNADAPSDAAVMKPLETQGWRGFVLSNGINPALGESDPWGMAVSVVDEAIRNAVAVGADPERIAILDNFCWGNPRNPQTLGSLVEAARGCHDAALHYGTPFISGKDSLNNEYLGADGARHAIPGTLLISAIGIHPDVRNAVTMDVKAAGNRVYLVGEWKPFGIRETGNRKWAFTPIPDSRSLIPESAPQAYRALHAAMRAGLVRAAHDLSEGGLAVAAAEMCIGGRLGVTLEIADLGADDALALFGETNGCLLVEVAPEDALAFEMQFEGLPLTFLGLVTPDAAIVFSRNGTAVMQTAVEDAVRAFTSPT
jgi:phosphoribosylformylglycinamidine synthase